MGVGAPQQCSLGAVACYLLVMLTCALLMTSSHSEGRKWSGFQTYDHLMRHILTDWKISNCGGEARGLAPWVEGGQVDTCDLGLFTIPANGFGPEVQLVSSGTPRPTPHRSPARAHTRAHTCHPASSCEKSSKGRKRQQRMCTVCACVLTYAALLGLITTCELVLVVCGHRHQARSTTGTLWAASSS